MSLRARLAAAVVACVGFLVISSGSAQAADNGSWAVTPTPPTSASAAPRSYFVYDAAPGATIKDKLRVQNLTARTLTFTLYGADGFNTATDGFFALKGHDEAQADVGSWVALPITQIHLAGHTQVDVPFSVRVPQNATPGDHVGGVVALNEAIEGTQEEGDVKIGVQRAIGARLYLRVAGPTTPGLAVSKVKLATDRGILPWAGSGSGTVTYTITNTGNVRLSPDTAIKVGGLAGHQATTHTKGLVDLLPGQQVQLTARVNGIRWFDRLSTEVVATSNEGATAHADAVNWQTPWTGLAVGLAVLVAVGFGIQRRRTAVARGMQTAEQAPALDLTGTP